MAPPSRCDGSTNTKPAKNGVAITNPTATVRNRSDEQTRLRLERLAERVPTLVAARAS